MKERAVPTALAPLPGLRRRRSRGNDLSIVPLNWSRTGRSASFSGLTVQAGLATIYGYGAVCSRHSRAKVRARLRVDPVDECSLASAIHRIEDLITNVRRHGTHADKPEEYVYQQPV